MPGKQSTAQPPKLITAHGITQPLSAWAASLNVSPAVILNRIRFGWSPEDAVSSRPRGPRPGNDTYFLSIAVAVAARSTCGRRAVGCVLVDTHNFIVATAYNAVPRGFPHCTEHPCDGASAKTGENLHLCRSRHAEELALFRCKDIYSLATAYTTTSPCRDCTFRLLDTSCARIVFIDEYPHIDAKNYWLATGREWVHLTTKK